jgi:cytochrome c biogenesis protein CcdA
VLSAPVGALGSRAKAVIVAGPVAFAVASVATAAAFGTMAATIGALAVGALGEWPAVMLRTVCGAIAIAYALDELARRRLPVPQRHWQVPQEWGEWGHLAYAAAFGASLGVGFLTFVPFVGYWLVLASTTSLANPVSGCVVLGAFGLGRALPALLLAAAPVSGDGGSRRAYRILASPAEDGASLRAIRVGVLFGLAFSLL